jgi:hypothetical protein
MAESETGYYFFSGMMNCFLFYMDKTTMKSVVLCNKPDCLHYNESNNEQISKCNAFFVYANASITYYNSHIYLFDNANETRYDKVTSNLVSLGWSLYQVSNDGTKRQKIFTILEKPSSLMIHRGYIYYSTNDYGSAASLNDSAVSICKIYRISLSNLDQSPELIYTYSGYNADVFKLVGYQNYIYFLCIDYPKSSSEVADNLLMSYNITNKEISQINNDVGSYAVCGGKIVYYSFSGDVYRCNLDGSETIILNHVNGVPYSDEKYIIIDSGSQDMQGNPIKRQLKIFDIGGKEHQSYDIDKIKNVTILGSSDDYIFLYDNGGTSNEFGGIDAIWIIYKDTVSEPIKVFEYIPKVVNNGVVIPN